ncbi:MAG: mannonate dehydratase [Pseudomonadota bacterium]
MRESWRWFGPNDPVSIDDIRQTGATDIVSALHDVAIGDVWSVEAIRRHKALIETCEHHQTPLRWTVVESIPVHESIKRGTSEAAQYTANWVQCLENLANCGIRTICYNFMPVIDWTRTDLNHRLPSGAYALRFDQHKFAAFDLHILERSGAEAEYSAEEQKAAKQTFESMSDEERKVLTQNIIAGLPGRMTDSYSIEDFREALVQYSAIAAEDLRRNLIDFLAAVIPVAERLDVKLAIHPDDPPRDMFGLPRIMCTADDVDRLFKLQPSEANGITLCVGTYGSRPDNDLPAMADRFGHRIHFAHLRGVLRDADEQRSFIEASHLDSDIDMVGVIKALLNEEQKRTRRGDLDNPIYIRPDHGHLMLDDIGKSVNPGYSSIGRMKGLAEIRGVIRALSNH